MDAEDCLLVAAMILSAVNGLAPAAGGAPVLSSLECIIY